MASRKNETTRITELTQTHRSLPLERVPREFCPESIKIERAVAEMRAVGLARAKR